MLKIRSWDGFEKSDTRKVAGPLSWCARSCDLLGEPMLEIMAEADALSILGAFDLIVRYQANRPAPDRAKSIDLSPRVLAVALRISEAPLRRAVSVLARPSVAWVATDWPEVENVTPKSEVSANVPTVVGTLSDDHPTVVGANYITLHNTTLEKKAPTALAAACASADVVAGETTAARQTDAEPEPIETVKPKRTRAPRADGSTTAVPELALWDRRFKSLTGLDYPRTAWAKETALAKQIRSPACDAMQTLSEAMDEALTDKWFIGRGGDFSLFVSTFARWTTLAAKPQTAKNGSAGGALGVLARDHQRDNQTAEPQQAIDWDRLNDLDFDAKETTHGKP